jgi:hypothetical protein
MKVPAKTEAEERAEKMRLALSASTAEATPKLGVSAVLSPAAQPASEPKKYRLSGYCGAREIGVIQKIRASFDGKNISDNVLIRACLLAAEQNTENVRKYIERIISEDRRRKK